jgi:hypothetical protein
MLTTALTAGADPAPPAAAAPAPGAPAVVAPGHPPVVVSTGSSCTGCTGGCNSCADTCCEEKPGLFSRFRGMFSKKNDCCDTCNTCQPVQCKPVCQAPVSCCTNTCNDCCEKEGFFSRLRGRFKKKDDCCEAPCGGCSGCGSGAVIHGAPGGAVVPAVPVGEPIAPPKKMPTDTQPKTTDNPPKVGAVPVAPVVTPVGAPTGPSVTSNPF